LAAVLGSGATVDESLEIAAKEMAGGAATAVLDQTRAFGDALRGQFG